MFSASAYYANESDASDSAHSSDLDDGDAAALESAQQAESKEVMSLFLISNRVGCAIYKPQEYRIECFETAIVFTNAGGAAVSAFGRRGGGGGRGKQRQCDGFLPVTSTHDVPNGLLWLLRYLECRGPDVVLPDAGAQLLREVVTVAGGCRVLCLSTQSTFRADAALGRLAQLFERATPQQLEARFQRRHNAMLAALDALLSYGAMVRLNIADVVERAPLSVLYMTPESMAALQLTRTEAHPCDYQNVGKPKEGLSLLSVVDLTCSVGGHLLLRQWFALPSADLRELQRRQEVVAYFASPTRRQLICALRSAIKRTAPCGNIFTRIRCGKAVLRDYRALFRSIRGFISVYELLEPCAHEVEPLYAMLTTYFDVAELRRLERLLAQTVIGVHTRAGRGSGAVGRDGVARASRVPTSADNGGSSLRLGAAESEVHICSDADATGQLADLRVRFENLSSSLQHYAQSATQQLPPSLQKFLRVQCVYVSSHGYLLCVSRDVLANVRLSDIRGSGFGPLSSANSALRPKRAADGRRSTDVLAQAADDGGAGENIDGEARPATGMSGGGACDLVDENVDLLQSRLGWVKHHDEGDVCCFKSEEMLYLDQHVGDLTQRIRCREEAVRKVMDDELLYRSLYLLPPQRAVAELDCHLSFSECAYRFQWTRPTLCPASSPGDGILQIESGWHAVLGCGIGTAALTPFTISVTRPEERINLVMGCNGSGKSALLGAIASIVFLAQLGSFVPAASATLSVFRSVLTVSTGSQLGHSPYSSFSAECVALNDILHHVDAAASAAAAAAEVANDNMESHAVLVLLDELGRGTDPSSGQAVLEATIRYLAGERAAATDSTSSGAVAATDGAAVPPAKHRPLLFCATHFLEILDDSPAQTVPAAAEGGCSYSFPFESVRVYDMYSTPIYADGEGGHSATHVKDLIPSFEPLLVTARPGSHLADYREYRSKRDFSAGPLLGRRIGLLADLVDSWEDTYNALRNF